MDQDSKEVIVNCTDCGKPWGTAPNQQMADEVKIALCQECASK